MKLRLLFLSNCNFKMFLSSLIMKFFQTSCWNCIVWDKPYKIWAFVEEGNFSKHIFGTKLITIPQSNNSQSIT